MNDQTKQGSYGQFCPVAMAAEIICSRWTALILREMLCGTTRFNDLRRGVPLMSPTLLSKRLKELTDAGVIAVKRTGQQGVVEYKLTEAGEDLRGVIMSLGTWGQRWVESSLSLKNLDPSLLMWDMRRNLVPSLLPDRRCTVKFTYPELSAGRKSWWIVSEGGEVDLCSRRSRLRHRSVCEQFAAQHDRGLDGCLDAEGRDRRRQHHLDRRQGGRAFDAAMARPQPVRGGKEPGGELSSTSPRLRGEVEAVANGSARSAAR